MKKFLLALCFLAACSRATTTTTTKTRPVGAPRAKTKPAPAAPRAESGLTGAATPRGAVLDFLAAVKSQDIQAMSVIFGTKGGPSRDNMDRNELEKRLIILQCYFSNDKFRITGEAPGEGGHRIFTVELTKGGNIRTPRFYSVAGPSNRYYVDNMEIAAVRDFCRK
ncbi:MAG: hypothetical protein ABIQ55_01195 [Gemmatimonadaceae bacterium]